MVGFFFRRSRCAARACTVNLCGVYTLQIRTSVEEYATVALYSSTLVSRPQTYVRRSCSLMLFCAACRRAVVQHARVFFSRHIDFGNSANYWKSTLLGEKKARRRKQCKGWEQTSDVYKYVFKSNSSICFRRLARGSSRCRRYIFRIVKYSIIILNSYRKRRRTYSRINLNE